MSYNMLIKWTKIRIVQQTMNDTAFVGDGHQILPYSTIFNPKNKLKKPQEKKPQNQNK